MKMMLAVMAGCLACLVIMYWLWRKYGRGRVSTDRTQTEPPDGVNSFEAGAIWNGSYDYRGALSLLPYLASAGYIGIRMDNNYQYTIIRAGSYDGDNKYEGLLLDGLFNTDLDQLIVKAEKNGDTVTLQQLRARRAAMDEAFQITSLNRDRDSDLLMVVIDGKNRDSKLLDFILQYITDTANMDEIRRVKDGHLMWQSNLIKCSVCALTLILLVVTDWVLVHIHGVLTTKGIMPKLALLAYAIIPVWLYALAARRIRFLNKIGLVISYGLILGAVAFVRTVPQIQSSGATEVNIYGAVTTFALVCLTVAIMQIMAIYLSGRNARMVSQIGAVRGYRRYLRRIEKPRIDATDTIESGNDHEQLAYMYALRVSNTWVRRLEVLK